MTLDDDVTQYQPGNSRGTAGEQPGNSQPKQRRIAGCQRQDTSFLPRDTGLLAVLLGK